MATVPVVREIEQYNHKPTIDYGYLMDESGSWFDLPSGVKHGLGFHAG